MNGVDPQSLSLEGAFRIDHLPLPEEGTGVFLVCAGQDSNKRRFTCAVFADDAVRLAPRQR